MSAPGEFDPDAYLTSQAQATTSFDPDKHLDSVIASAAPISTAKYNPTDGMSNTDLALSGAGKAFVDTGTGIKQLVAHLGHKMGLVSDSDLAKINAEVNETKTRDTPLMNTTAGTLGNIGGQGAMLLAGPEGLAGAVGGSAALSAAQPVADGESRVGNAIGGAVGGGLGYGAGKMVGKVVQPFKSALTDTMASHIDVLRNAGIPLDLAQSTGNKGAQVLKNAVADNPVVGGSAMPVQQKAAFNKAVLATIGENGSKADQATLESARSRIGQVFDDVAERNPIKFDDKLQHELTQTHVGASAELSDAQMKPVNSQINTILDKAAEGNGQIDGKAYQNIKSTLDRISMGGDQATGHWARQVRTALDNALQRSASPEDLESLMTARKQYRGLKQIQNSIDDSEDISPAKLVNSIDTKANAAQTVYGKGDQDLYRLALAGKNVISNSRTPNSGTAQRLAGMAALGGGADALLDRDEHGGVKVGNIAKYAALGVGLPSAARMLVENPRAVAALTSLSKSKIASGVATGLGRLGQAAGTKYGQDELGGK